MYSSVLSHCHVERTGKVVLRRASSFFFKEKDCLIKTEVTQLSLAAHITEIKTMSAPHRLHLCVFVLVLALASVHSAANHLLNYQKLVFPSSNFLPLSYLLHLSYFHLYNGKSSYR